MGHFERGQWREGRPPENFVGGRWERTRAHFRGCFPEDGFRNGELEPGRFILIESPACPWCHRVSIVSALRGLEQQLPRLRVHWLLGEDGWELTPEAGAQLAAPGAPPMRWLRELYVESDPEVSGTVTVPVLWDQKTRKIVNNESEDLIRMLDAVSNGSRDDEPPLFPPGAREELLDVNERIYHEVNDGVYRCGFARTQAAYDEAVDRLFSALDWLEARLSTRQWLVGPHRTEADWRLFPTLIRFEYIYRGHFRCSRRSLTDYPGLWAYTRALFQVPGVAEVTDMEETRRHYYLSHKSLNPSGILPVAPELDLLAPHGRETLD